MDKKSLSNGKKFCIILFLSAFIIAFGVNVGFSMRYVISKYITEFLLTLLCTVIIGIITIKLLMILLHDYKTDKKKKTNKWYLDKVCIALVPVWVTAAVTLTTFGSSDEIIYFCIAVIMFILIGIIIAPNAASYAVKETKDWKSIFYNKGNLDKNAKVKSFYKMNTPVSFEKKLYFTVFKSRILNFHFLIICIVIFMIIAISAIINPPIEYSGGIINAIIYVKTKRAVGFLFFGLIALSTFLIPLIVYYITNARCKLKIIRHHEYIAYHAIVNKVDGCVLKINYEGLHYKYNYCTCVGIRPKNVNNTEAILIFIPDDVLLYPVK